MRSSSIPLPRQRTTNRADVPLWKRAVASGVAATAILGGVTACGDSPPTGPRPGTNAGTAEPSTAPTPGPTTPATDGGTAQPPAPPKGPPRVQWVPLRVGLLGLALETSATPSPEARAGAQVLRAVAGSSSSIAQQTAAAQRLLAQAGASAAANATTRVSAAALHAVGAQAMAAARAGSVAWMQAPSEGTKRSVALALLTQLPAAERNAQLAKLGAVTFVIAPGAARVTVVTDATLDALIAEKEKQGYRVDREGIWRFRLQMGWSRGTSVGPQTALAIFRGQKPPVRVETAWRDGRSHGQIRLHSVGRSKYGDLEFLRADYADYLLGVMYRAEQAGRRITVSSGFRSYGDQQALYRKFHGTRPVAAPGYSNHQMGDAADLDDGSGTSLRRSTNQWLVRNTRLTFPVRGENWHAELRG